MKVITEELLQFALIGAVATILFRWVVTFSIIHHSMVWVWPALAVYFCIMFFGATYYGKLDYRNNHIRDLGVRFHLLLYVLKKSRKSNLPL